MDTEEIPSIYRGVHFFKRRRSVDSRACIQQNHEGHMSPCCPNAYSRCDVPTTKAPTSALTGCRGDFLEENETSSLPGTHTPKAKGAGWGTIVSFRSNGVVVTGGDRCSESIIDTEELPSIYRGVHFSKRRNQWTAEHATSTTIKAT
ncbi:hypothetical protein MRX96_001350 [Rhipicephalus microplus]